MVKFLSEVIVAAGHHHGRYSAGIDVGVVAVHNHRLKLHAVLIYVVVTAAAAFYGRR